MKRILFSYILLVLASIVVRMYAQQFNGTQSNDSIKLDELVVTENNIKATPTGYTVNLSNNVLTRGKSTVEVLDYLPNLSLEDGIVKINGLAASEIRIDGRKISSMSELTNLPANFIKSVEVVYTASLDQITSSPGGTINIRLKPVASMGFYGAVWSDLTAGKRNGLYSENISGIVNARIGKLSIYLAPQFRWMDMKGWDTQSFISPQQSSWTKLLSNRRMRNFTNALSLSYEFNPDHQLGLSWSIVRVCDHRLSSNDGDKSPMMASASHPLSNWLTFRYEGRLNDKGTKLIINAEWLNITNSEKRDFYSGTVPDHTMNTDQSTNMFEIKAGIQQPIGKEHQFSAGATFRLTDLHTSELSQTSHQLRNQKIIARTPLVHALMQGRLGCLQYSAGLNWQQNQTEVLPGLTHRQNAINPSVQLSYPFGPDNIHMANVVYRHTLDDVPYDAISERVTWNDPLSYTVGNKDLKARSMHYVSLMVGLINNTVNLSASYWRFDNPVYWRTYTKAGSDISYTMPVNVPAENVYYFMAEFNKQFFGRWNVKAMARIGFNTETYQAAEQIRHQTHFRQYYSLASSINLRGGWGASANFYIEPTFHFYDREYHTVYQLDMAIYKYLLNNTMQVSLMATPAATNRRLIRRSDDATISSRHLTPKESVALRLVWWFRGGKKDIRVNVNQTSLNYSENRDAL